MRRSSSGAGVAAVFAACVVVAASTGCSFDSSVGTTRGDTSDRAPSDSHTAPTDTEGPGETGGTTGTDMTVFDTMDEGSGGLDDPDGISGDRDAGDGCSSRNCPEPESTCSNDKDDDGDGRTDCADPDCSNLLCSGFGGARCEKQTCVETNCSDGRDNDGDGLTDCDDSDCPGSCTGSMERNCADGIDNDGDGKTDCRDANCDQAKCGASGGAKCINSECVEVWCSDGRDNDGDQLPDDCDGDCAAMDCRGPAIQCSTLTRDCIEVVCDDDKDNDADGHTDCGDSECKARTCDTNKRCCFDSSKGKLVCKPSSSAVCP